MGLPLRLGNGRPLFRPSLVASDLDGTLLSPDGSFPAALGAGVRALRAAGVPFVVSTGRMLVSARHVLNRLGIADGPIVCYQGALVADLGTGGHYLDSPVPTTAAAEIVRFAHSRGRHINAFVDDRFYTDQDDEWARRYAEVSEVDCTIVPDLAALVEQRPPSKLLITAAPEEVDPLLPEMQERWRGVLYITRSQATHIEINREGADKSTALDFLCSRLGVSREGTVACGDSFNDVDMLHWATLGVAVAEAPGAVLAEADLVVPRAELGILFEQLAAAG